MTKMIIVIAHSLTRALHADYMWAGASEASEDGDALEGQVIVCEQWFAPPMLCLFRTF